MHPDDPLSAPFVKTHSSPLSDAGPPVAPPEVIERLESLDDIIFPAIDGDEQAIAQSKPAWQEAVAQLDPELVQESRNEYLRYAQHLGISPPQRTFSAAAPAGDPADHRHAAGRRRVGVLHTGSSAASGVANHQRWPSASRAPYSRCPYG